MILDKDSTIGKFRDYVTSLNEHNATLRQELQKHTDAPQEKQEPSQVIDYKVNTFITLLLFYYFFFF